MASTVPEPVRQGTANHSKHGDVRSTTTHTGLHDLLISNLLMREAGLGLVGCGHGCLLQEAGTWSSFLYPFLQTPRVVKYSSV